MKLLALFVAWLVMLPLAGPAAAAPSLSKALAKYKPTATDALAHLVAGNRSYKASFTPNRARPDRVRDLKRAIAEYTAGQAREDAPAFDFNLGYALQALDHLQELDHAADAIEHLQRFLDRAKPEDAIQRSVDKDIADMDPSGEIRAELRKKAEAAAAPVAAPAQPTPDTTPAVATPSLSPPSSAPSAPVLSTSAPAAPRAAASWDRIGWSLTAVGLVGAGVAAWLLVDAANLGNDAKDLSRSMSTRLDLQDQSDSRHRLGVGVAIGSGAVLVAGIIKLAIPTRSDSTPTRTGFNLGITGNGVAVFGRF